jgi:hypothetical protein
VLYTHLIFACTWYLYYAESPCDDDKLGIASLDASYASQYQDEKAHD